MNGEDIPARDQVFLNPWLGDYLSAANIKQSELARAMVVDSSLVYLWSSGQRPVPHNRLDALAAALELTRDEVMSHARITKNGYHILAEAAKPATAPAKIVPVERVEIAIVAPPEPTLAPSAYPLLWCESTHGTGVHRVHHHGPAPSWAPGFLTLERDPTPYVRPQAIMPHVVWPRQALRIPPPVSEPPKREATPPTPQADFGRDVLIDPSQWKDAEIPVAGPPKPPTEEVQQKHTRRAQVRRVREVIEAPFVTAHHRGHIALGVACHCEAS